jgi:hypothetical protein
VTARNRVALYKHLSFHSIHSNGVTTQISNFLLDTYYISANGRNERLYVTSCPDLKSNYNRLLYYGVCKNVAGERKIRLFQKKYSKFLTSDTINRYINICSRKQCMVVLESHYSKTRNSRKDFGCFMGNECKHVPSRYQNAALLVAVKTERS